MNTKKISEALTSSNTSNTVKKNRAPVDESWAILSNQSDQVTKKMLLPIFKVEVS